MNIKNILAKLRYGSTVEWYNFWYVALRRKQRITPDIASIEQTVQTIVEQHASISRFGDGELLLTDPTRNIGFQHGSPELAERLREVLTSHNEGHLVCLSDTFRNIERYNRRARRFWRTHFFLYGKQWDRYLVEGRRYYNTFVTRPYMDFESKEACGAWFNDMKRIWDDRDVVFIEGAKSRLGVGNDLFDNARSVRRILCPPCDAFEKIGQILTEALKVEPTALFLVALGPTATVLSYDLFKQGRQAIDIGHVDIEYEWWRMGARRKVKLAYKYVNEARDGREVNAAGNEYEQQIIARIP